MAIALPGLALGRESDARYVAVAIAHLGLALCLLLALVAGRRIGRARARVAQDWLPLAAIPLLYAELPYLIAAMGAEFGDATVQRWELALWGDNPARTLAAAAPWTWLSEALHLAYLSYYAIIYLPLAWLWLRSRPTGTPSRAVHMSPPARDPAFREAALGVMATFVACFAIFILFPVQGPRYLWPSPEGVPDGPVRDAVLGILERGSSRGAAFPSSHMAVAVVQALMAIRWRIPGRVLIAVLTAGLGVGAVYGGFHYAVDMLAGAAVGGIGFLAAVASSRVRQRRSRDSTSARAPSRT